MDKLKKIITLLIKIVIFIYKKIGDKLNFLVAVKDKITAEMYKKEKEKNKDIGTKLKETNKIIEGHKNKVYEITEELNNKNRRITNLEEQVKKLDTKLRLLEKENERLNKIIESRLDEENKNFNRLMEGKEENDYSK